MAAILNLTTGIVFLKGWSGTVTGGTLAVADGTAAAPSLTFASESGLGILRGGSHQLDIESNNVRAARFSDTTQSFSSGNFTIDVNGNSLSGGNIDALGRIGIGGSVGAPNVILQGDAADTLAQRRGTNQQTFNLYGTYTDASNFDRIEMVADDINSVFYIRTRAGGTGTVRPLAFGVGGQTDWRISTSHHLVSDSDNANDFGAANATSARNVYASTAFVKNGGNGGLFSNLQSLTELTTIAAAATTDTTIQMPANAVVLAVSVRVTTIIPTATSFSVGDSGSAARFSTANVAVAANSTDSGTKAGAYYNASALSIRLTMIGGTPAANTGRVRVTIYYYTVTPPTS